MKFNESIYIDKTEECPSDIIINSIADHKDIIDLMHKICIIISFQRILFAQKKESPFGLSL